MDSQPEWPWGWGCCRGYGKHICNYRDKQMGSFNNLTTAAKIIKSRTTQVSKQTPQISINQYNKKNYMVTYNNITH